VPDASESELSAAQLGDADRDIKKILGNKLPRVIHEVMDK
jgi:hypothetical protein